MASTSDRAVRETQQARAAKAVRGLLLVIMGGLFTLDNLGRIDLRPPGLYPASNAVDGDLTTRWSSAFDDPQWITIDLGSVRDLAGEAFLGGGLCPCLPDRGLDRRPDLSFRCGR